MGTVFQVGTKRSLGENCKMYKKFHTRVHPKDNNFCKFYVAILVNNSRKHGLKVMKETIADNGIDSRHVEKGFFINVRRRTAERLAHASKMTQEKTTPTI
jgi:hypothetical protein